MSRNITNVGVQIVESKEDGKMPCRRLQYKMPPTALS